MSQKIIPKVLVNTALGLILIFIWSRFVNLGSLWQSLKTVDRRIVVVFILLFIASGALRTLRFKLLLNNIKVNFLDLLKITFLGQMLSFMVPVRAGEISKAVYLSSQHSLPFAKVLVWVFIDRFMDFWVAVLLIMVLLFSLPAGSSGQIGVLATVAVVGLSGIYLLAIISQTLFKGLMVKLSRVLVFPKAKDSFINFTHSIIEGFLILKRKPTELVGLLAVTVLATLVDSLVWIALFYSLGFRINPLTAVLGNALSALTFLVPSAPGYVGSAEAAILAVFSGILGLEPNLVASASIIFHVLTIILILICGLVSLYLLKFDLSLVWKKLRS